MNGMANLSAYKGKPWSAWISSVENSGLFESKEDESDSEVTLLPREDSVLYGICPKLEVFKAIECSKCGAVVKPQALSRHVELWHLRDANFPPPQLPIRKHKSSKSKSKKSSLPPPAPPPPPPLQVPAATGPIENSSSNQIKLETTTSNSRHRKTNRKSNKSKDYANEKHTKIEETNHKTEPASCQRTSPCTPQQVQHKSRNKSSKEQPTAATTSSTVTTTTTTTISATTVSTTVSNSELTKHHMSPITVSITMTSNSVPAIVQISTSQPSITVPMSLPFITSVNDAEERDSDLGYSSSDTLPQTSLATTTPTLVYALPIIHLSSAMVSSPSSQSPLYLYTKSPATPIEHPPTVRHASPQPASSPPLTSQQSLFTVALPEQVTNITFYNAHPKPMTMSTFSTRRIGNSIVLPNHRVEKQRNDIQSAIQAKRTSPIPSYKPVSVLNTHRRPIILKNTGSRGTPKILPATLKRASTERLETTDCKQIALATYCTMT